MGAGSDGSATGTAFWAGGKVPELAPELLRDIIATAADLAIVLDRAGKILSLLVNPDANGFGQLGHWVGRDVRGHLTRESIPKLELQLELLGRGEGSTRAVELNHVDRAAWEFPIRYTFHRIDPDGAILMLGRDLRPIAEMQRQLIRAQLALERDYEAQRDYDTRYRVLMEAAPEAVLFVSAASGEILDANGAASEMCGLPKARMLGGPVGRLFAEEPALAERLLKVAMAGASGGLDLSLSRDGLAVHVQPMLFRAAGEQVILCRIQPRNIIAPTADALSESLNALYTAGTDAIVFTDPEGMILTANEAFLNMIDAAHAGVVRGASLGDHMARGSLDLRLLLEHTVQNGHMRVYATRLVSQFGTEISVEMSATWLKDVSRPSIVFVMRDTSRSEIMRKGESATAPLDGVADLVGSASLKEIVAETTDAMEKLCIETALQLSNDNRVAAAEMLGLSRQSLYVKLRKFGLLAREGAEE